MVGGGERRSGVGLGVDERRIVRNMSDAMATRARVRVPSLGIVGGRRRPRFICVKSE